MGGWVGLQIISGVMEDMPPADEVVGGREGGREGLGCGCGDGGVLRV